MVKASLKENEYSQHCKLQAFIGLPAFNLKHVTMMYVSANVGLSLEEAPVSTSTLERTRTSVLGKYDCCSCSVISTWSFQAFSTH